MPDAGFRRGDGDGGVILGGNNLDGVLRLRIGAGTAAVAVGVLELGSDEKGRAETVGALQGINLAVVLANGHVGAYFGGGVDVETIVGGLVMVAFESAEA